jgi:hypothetical protein
MGTSKFMVSATGNPWEVRLPDVGKLWAEYKAPPKRKHTRKTAG